MKNLLRVISLLSVLIVIFFATVQVSHNQPKPESVGEKDPFICFTITVFTKPECYSGTCYAIDANDTWYAIPSTGSSYYGSPSGLHAGTYTIKVCCDGMWGYGTVTLGDCPSGASTTVELQPGQCPPDNHW